jgi:acyl-CoA thioester hydrolase
MPPTRVKPADAALTETWRGCCNAWDCDEMGHMNVRVYVARWQEGLASLAAACGLPEAFAPDATGTLIPVDQHIRFLAEARAGDPIALYGGLIDINSEDAVVYQELRHIDGRVAAAFVTRVVHAGAKDMRPFPWPRRCAPLMQALVVAMPKHAEPRSIDTASEGSDVTKARADALGAARVGRGLVQPEHLDVFGRARADAFIGRISDAAPNLMAPWREAAGKDQGRERLGGAVVEYRILYREWPTAGRLIDVRSGVVEVGEKHQRLIHWLIDPVGGEAYATAEAVALTFDLKARKAVAPSAAQRDALAAQIIKGLTI